MKLPSWHVRGLVLHSIHWNFFRIHLACFTLVPLVVSGVLYAGNAASPNDPGRQWVGYIDCLFLCYSAMTTTGLVTVNLSSLHAFQQAVLLCLAIVGNVSFVALLMVLVRKRFFRVHCEDLIARDRIRRTASKPTGTMAPVSEIKPRNVSCSDITGPIRSEPLHRYIPDRSIAESPVNTQSILDETPYNSRRTSGRNLLRARTLGQKSVDPAAQIAALPALGRPIHTGLGGYPVLTKLGRYLIRLLRLPERNESHKHTLLTREEAYTTEDWTDTAHHRVSSWLPAGLGGLVVGRNSRFYTEELEDEELEQIGGVEYRALRFLSYFVGAYMFLFQVVPFAILAVYFSTTRYWSSDFQASPGVQSASVPAVWASLYFSIAAYTGSGFSLVDQGLVPFAGCYLLIWLLNLVMLVGNHAFPMVLRLLIWLGARLTGDTSLNQTLHFLLDHPRRCFLYLFPSHQTWYLALALIAFIAIEMISFLVLNIGLPVVEDITSGWQKFSVGLLQSLSVRASGFGIVAVANLSPSTLFLYVILMYIAIYPIALSVRSTNVYEEQALGVYHTEDSADQEEPATAEPAKSDKKEVFSKYLIWHVRRQLAFDIWPLALAVFLIACFERDKLMGDTGSWFTIFRIIFECTSAYSLIGLSLGTPNNNFAFSGEFTVISKIVIILVMIRGRHRGLPVAIDRAIMLPKTFARAPQPS